MPNSGIRTLNELLRALAAASTVEGVVGVAVQGVKGILGVDAAFAAVGDPSSNYKVSARVGVSSPQFAAIVIPPAVGLGGIVAVGGAPMHVHDYGDDPDVSPDFVDIVVGREHLRGVACVPVWSGGRVEALLYSALRSPGFLGDHSLDVMSRVADCAGIAMSNAVAQHQPSRRLGRWRGRRDASCGRRCTGSTEPPSTWSSPRWSRPRPEPSNRRSSVR
jgi:GAF domain-containing protein